jgi:hypothetical protein
VQHSGVTCAERRSLGRFDSDKSDVRIVEEAGEDADCVGAAPDAGDYNLGQPAFNVAVLLSCFVTDHGLQLAHDLGVRGRADARADQVVRRLDVRDPVANRFARRLFERPGAEVDGMDVGAEQVHALDVGPLAPHVLFAHVDDALEAEACAHGCRCDAVLSSAGFRHDAVFAEPSREHGLAEGVVELVCARVQEILPLQVEAFAGREPLGAGQRCRTARERAAEFGELRMERLVCLGVAPARLEFVERRNQRFRDVTAAVGPVEPRRRLHRAASTNARTLS